MANRRGMIERACVLLLLAAMSAVAVAQRVQLPTPNTPGGFGPPPQTFGDPQYPQQSTFGQPSYNQPGYVQPALGNPTFAPPAANIGPPPAFDSYNSGGVAPPPAAIPYQYAPPAGGAADAYTVPPPAISGPAYPSYPAYPSEQYGTAPGFDGSGSGGYFSGGVLSGENIPFGWEPGTYGIESSGGYETGGYGWEGAAGTLVSVKRFLQQLSYEQTYLLGEHQQESPSILRTEISGTFTYPIFGNIDRPLLLTPGFAFNWFHGPEGDPAVFGDPNLPPRVYDAYLDAAWYPQITPTFGMELGLRTGVWTDFKHVNSDSVRVLGRGLGVVRVSESVEILAGAVYLDRVRVKLLPAGGFRWHPNEIYDFYVVFPNPKARKRIVTASTTSWWWYISGEYGGGSWTLEREVKGDDRIDYNDIRVVLGVEWETPTLVRGHLEVGYAFDREILFNDTRNPPIFKPDDTVMFRAGIDY